MTPMLHNRVAGTIHHRSKDRGWCCINYGGELFFAHIRLFPKEQRGFISEGELAEISVPRNQKPTGQWMRCSEAKLLNVHVPPGRK
jgi:hypothetical protein